MGIRKGFWFVLVVFFLGLVFMLCSDRASGQAPRADRTVRMKVTAYCLCEKCCGRFATTLSMLKGGMAIRTTSIGDDATACDGVAADPKLLPYRTRLRIPGVGLREVDDMGGAPCAALRRSASRTLTYAWRPTLKLVALACSGSRYRF